MSAQQRTTVMSYASIIVTFKTNKARYFELICEPRIMSLHAYLSQRFKPFNHLLHAPLYDEYENSV